MACDSRNQHSSPSVLRSQSPASWEPYQGQGSVNEPGKVGFPHVPLQETGDSLAFTAKELSKTHHPSLQPCKDRRRGSLGLGILPFGQIPQYMLSQERTVTVGRKRRSKIRKLCHLRWHDSVP